MPKLESLGILGVESIHYYVRDLERSRRFYCDKLDFAELGESGPELTERGKQKSVLFSAGDIHILCSAPVGEGGRADRFLKKHPDGIGTVTYEVADIQRTFSLLEQRGGTPIDEVKTHDDGKGGKLRTFSITTPFGDTTFRFVERTDYTTLLPGLVLHDTPRGGKNVFGFEQVDHVTTNFQTMKPALLWMEHVLGLEQLWDVQFHTDDVSTDKSRGSGLRSIVMWDPESGIKFANNEPWRPFFKASQINIFNEDHRGDGVQHVALTVRDIIPSIEGLRGRGIQFMPTPGTYYDMLPERLKKLGVEKIEEDISTLDRKSVV